MKPKYLNVINNIAYIRNTNLVDLARNVSTPLYVFDEVELKENMDMFVNNFSFSNYNTHVVYASKAFLVKEMCSLLNEKGLWMDAVSLGDLFVAYNSGFNMEHIMFHGNNKSIEEINFAIEHNSIIVVDNIEELKTICSLGKKVKTMFRVNPGIEAHTHEYIQTSLLSSKFGESIFDLNKIEEIFTLYKNNPNVLLLGFHSHIGSQILSSTPFIKNIEVTMEFSSNVSKKYNYPLCAINFGGGFGINYNETDNTLDKVTLLHDMMAKFNELNIKYELNIKDIFIEPGRSILGEACISLYECGTYKETYGKKNYQFINGGMTDNIRPALYQAIYSCDIANKMNDTRINKCDIAGKCCESGDILIKDALLPKTEPGDILMIYATGAYTYSMSSNYNNLLKPSVVFLTENGYKIVSQKQELDDLMRLF